MMSSTVSWCRGRSRSSRPAEATISPRASSGRRRRLRMGWALAGTRGRVRTRPAARRRAAGALDARALSSYGQSSEMVTDSTPKRRYRMRARAEAAAATEERLLAAGWRQFTERPYDDVRLTDVAAQAGVTVQTLHARFGRKDELFVAVWRWWAGPQGVSRDTAPVGDVRAAVRVLYASYEASGDAALRLLAQEDRIAAVKQMADDGRAWHRGWVERTFAPLIEGLPRAARERRLVALVVATDLLVWKLLRREMGLGRAAAERIVIDMVTASKGAP